MTERKDRINEWFRNFSLTVVKFRWLIILLFITINVVGFMGMSKLKVESSTEDWFVKGNIVKKATRQFREIFGNDEYAALLIESDDVFQPETLTILRELGKDLEKDVPFADKVVSLADFEFIRGNSEEIIVNNLVPETIPTSQEEIETLRKTAFSRKSLVNRLFSEDSKQTWLILRLQNYPDDWEEKKELNPQILIGSALLKTINQDKYKDVTIKATGLPVVETEALIYFTGEGMRLLGSALLIGILMLIVFQRTLRGVLLPLLTTMGSVIIMFGIMGYLGIKINERFMTIPSYLGLALSIGYSIHVFNFFNKNFYATGKRKESVYYAVQHVGWPVFFTALTTIGSLLSFCFVPIKPIQWIGYSSALLIAVIFLVTITFIPAVLSFGKDKNVTDTTKKILSFNRKIENRTDRVFSGLGGWVLKYSRLIVISFVVLLGICTYGLTKVEINLDMKKTLGDKIPYLSNIYYVCDSKIGSLYSYDILLNFKENDKIKDPELLKRFEAFSREIEQFESTKRVTSFLQILKE
ncbi:MAG: MMPL family transporter, partial [bacterium]|nr:MMPL family transporter [bacterium]